MVRFEGVDSSIATLMVSAYDVDVPLGSGAGRNVALLCKFYPMKPAEKAVMMIEGDGEKGNHGSKFPIRE